MNGQYALGQEQQAESIESNYCESGEWSIDSKFMKLRLSHLDITQYKLRPSCPFSDMDTLARWIVLRCQSS